MTAPAAPPRPAAAATPRRPADWPDEPTLRAHARVFTRLRSAQLIAGCFAAALAARVALGGWSLRDLVAPAAIVALQPFTEWLIHVFVLHFRPRTLLGRRIDPLVARKHRAHHADPRDLELVLVPLPVLHRALPIGALLALLVAPNPRLALSGLVAGYGVFLLYEWTHFLIHSRYRPRRWYYRSIWRSHRNHHHRNERYWFGVTVNLGDRVLRTFPQRDAVPLSDTARTLGIGTDPAAG